MSEGPKCPHCNGISGFEYVLILRATYHGVWSADDDTQMDAEREFTPKNVRCIDCRKLVAWTVAHNPAETQP